jgi:hypothetical protein
LTVAVRYKCTHEGDLSSNYAAFLQSQPTVVSELSLSFWKRSKHSSDGGAGLERSVGASAQSMITPMADPSREK